MSMIQNALIISAGLYVGSLLTSYKEVEQSSSLLAYEQITATNLEVTIEDDELKDNSINLSQLQSNSSSIDARLIISSGSLQWKEKYITENLTLNIPNDYMTIDLALSYLADKVIMSDVIVTIKFSDGIYNFSESIDVSHPDGNRINIIGNLVSPSSVVLNFSNTSGFSVINRNKLGLIDGVTLNGDDSASTYGIFASNNSLVKVGDNVVIRDFEKGISAVNSSFIGVGQSTVISNSIGIHTYRNSVIVFNGTSANNDIGVSAFRRSTITVNSASQVINNISYGIRARDYSAIHAQATSVSGNGINYSPGKDSEGNNESYIR